MTAPIETTEAAAPGRVSTGRLLGRGWRVFVPVVLVNAAVQAATVAPALTPAPTVWFVLLALASALALLVSAVLIVAQAHAAVGGSRLRLPARLWLAASVTVVVVGASALAAVPLILVTITAAFVVLPGVASGRASAGFRTFAGTPGRAVGLTAVTALTLVVLWVGALLLGFLITGALAGALTWLAFGAAAVLLVCAWTALIRRGQARPD